MKVNVFSFYSTFHVFTVCLGMLSLLLFGRLVLSLGYFKARHQLKP